LSVAFQIRRIAEIASRGVERETLARKFLIGLAVDLSTLVGLSVILTVPLILAAVCLPFRIGWMQAQRNRIWLSILGVALWQIPVSVLASYLLDAPSLLAIAAIGLLSFLLPPLLFRSIRPT
jgi:hypothetical protein